MLGTVINAGSIILGGLLGFVLKKAIKPQYEKSINSALGISILVLGLNGIISAMFMVKDGKVVSSGELLLVISLVVGTFLGEMLKIDTHLSNFGKKIESKFGSSGFAQSFVNGTLIYCVGAMAIIGALNSGLKGDISVLLVKSLLDGVSSVIFGATLGIGVVFAAIPVFLYQGAITLLAELLQTFLVGEVLNNLCAVGYCLVLCIGINFVGGTKIKTANMLPSLIIIVVLSMIF